VTHLRSTLAHEAAHVVGGLLAGHRIEKVTLGPTKARPNEAGTTCFDLAGSPDVDLFGHLVAVVMGPMAAGEPPPPWPPHPDPYNTDAFTAATVIHHLHLSKADYLAAVGRASHHLDDPQVKAPIALVADALGEAGELDDRAVREAVGPELLRRFYRARKGRGAVQHLALKAVAFTITDDGVFEAVISTQSVDREKDIVEPSAMVDALRKWNRAIPLSWNHSTDPWSVFGSINPQSVKEVDGEVVAAGEVDLESSVGREAWRSFKNRTVGFSFGYMIPEGGATNLPDGGRHITELDVLEVTATPTPMNNDTRVLSTKAVAEEKIPTDAELRAWAKRLGLEPPLSSRELRRRCAKTSLDAALGWDPAPRPAPEEPNSGPSEKELRRQAREVTLQAAMGWEELPAAKYEPTSTDELDAVRAEAQKHMFALLTFEDNRKEP
jgi:HK97 family phage prohead protease